MRYNALTVALESDIREDELERLINAVGLLRGVLEVKGHVMEVEQFVAESRVRQQLSQALWEVLYPKKDQN